MAAAPLALLVYSAQILVVVCLATLAVALSRLARPSPRLVYWRAVGGLCLALPLFSVVHFETPTTAAGFGAAMMKAVAATSAAPPLAATGNFILWIWTVGAVVCVARLLLGGFRLRQIRARSTQAALGAEIETLISTLAPRAEVRWSRHVNQPVTFGARRPVILLPRRFTKLSSEAQRAVVCHELLHIVRRDWLWTLFEEHVRALFWFHPAVWWVVQRVQLSREQVIDESVVARMVSRKPYMRALVVFAERQPAMPMSLAFLQRRDLAARLGQLSKESHMSSTRLAWTAVALLVVMCGATAEIVSALPLSITGVRLQVPSATRLEIRLAETEPANGLTEAVVSESDQRVYLHPAPILTEADIKSTAVLGARSPFSIAVVFNSEGSARMAQATREHIGRPVAIVLDGQVLMAPVLKGMLRDRASITGDFTRAEANELAAALATDREEQGRK